MRRPGGGDVERLGVRLSYLPSSRPLKLLGWHRKSRSARHPRSFSPRQNALSAIFRHASPQASSPCSRSRASILRRRSAVILRGTEMPARSACSTNTEIARSVGEEPPLGGEGGRWLEGLGRGVWGETSGEEGAALLTHVTSCNALLLLRSRNRR